MAEEVKSRRLNAVRWKFSIVKHSRRLSFTQRHLFAGSSI